MSGKWDEEEKRMDIAAFRKRANWYSDKNLCNQCGSELRRFPGIAGTTYCPTCDAKLRCRACGAKEIRLSSGHTYCTVCDAKIIESFRQY